MKVSVKWQCLSLKCHATICNVCSTIVEKGKRCRRKSEPTIYNVVDPSKTTVPLENVTPFDVKGETVQSTKSDITQTIDRHAYFVMLKFRRMCDHTRVTNNYELRGGQIQHGSRPKYSKGHAGNFFLACVHPGLDNNYKVCGI